MSPKKTFKERMIGLIMPLIFCSLLITRHYVFSDSSMSYPLIIPLLGILILWAIIEVFIMEGDSRIRFDFIDCFFKFGSLAGLTFSIIFGNLDNNKITISIGILLLIVGIILRYAAIKTLGLYFSYFLKAEKVNQSIVDYGIYRYIRHPSYLGIFLIIISFPIIYTNISGMVLVSIFSWLCIQKRISTEEKIMTNTFGELYQQYIKKTKRMIPFFY